MKQNKHQKVMAATAEIALLKMIQKIEPGATETMDEDVVVMLIALRCFCDKNRFDFGQLDKLAYRSYTELRAT